MKNNKLEQLLVRPYENAATEILQDQSGEIDKSTCPDCDCELERYYDGQGRLKYHCDNCKSGISFYESEDAEE